MVAALSPQLSTEKQQLLQQGHQGVQAGREGQATGHGLPLAAASSGTSLAMGAAMCGGEHPFNIPGPW